MSFSGLPIETVGTILSFVSDPQTLYRVACTCQEYSRFVVDNDDTLWRGLYRHWWKRGLRPRDTTLWRDSCRSRFQKDAEARQLLQEMAQSMSEYRDDTTFVLALAPLWEPDEDTWTNLMEMGVDVLECCLRMYREVLSSLPKALLKDKCRAYLAAVAAYHLETVNCFHEYHRLDTQVIDDQSALLEKLVVLIVKSHLTMEEFLSAGTEGATSIEREVLQQVDDLATKLRARMISLNVTVNEPALVVRLLMDIVFDDEGFQKFDIRKHDPEDYYQRHLLNHVLSNKTGGSFTIAILFKLVCSRVGIQVDAIKTSGVYLRVVPNDEEDDDVIFNMKKRETLSPADCRDLLADDAFSLSILNTPFQSTSRIVRALSTSLRSKRETSLLHRNNHLWQSVLRTTLSTSDCFRDPAEIAFEACPSLAGSLDGDTTI